MAPSVLYHFSEDPTITRFVPHVPRTNPTHSPAVWAIDAAHAPLYWFPRDCPRVAAWPRTESERAAFRAAFASEAWRVHALELGWLSRLTSTVLYRYELDPAAFVPWEGASGQWISHRQVEPRSVEPVGDLLDAHVVAGVELRLVPSLWALRELATSGPWDFSIVRLANARPPAGGCRS